MSTLIVANWKMNANKTQLVQFCEALNMYYSRDNPHIHSALLPPFPYLERAHEMLYHPQCHTGGQDCAPQKSGAFTGDVSASMIRDCGGHYVIVGHSERRLLHHEDDATLTNKIICALNADVVPIFCFGESESDMKQQRSYAVCKRQIEGVFHHPSLKEMSIFKIIFAYEPVWAIGTGLTPKAEDVNALLMQVAAFISDTMPMIAQYQFLYGGSVSADNFEDFIVQPLIHGALVGGASLKAETFIPLLEIAARHKPKA